MGPQLQNVGTHKAGVEHLTPRGFGFLGAVALARGTFGVYSILITALEHRHYYTLRFLYHKSLVGVMQLWGAVPQWVLTQRAQGVFNSANLGQG